jgi:hypothetical protein
MRRIAMLTLAAAAAVAVAPAPANAVSRCSGTIDTQCYTYTCSRTQCLEVICAVWVDVVAGQQSGCFG